MKTLVIHPLDNTTTMLSHVYLNKDYTVLRDIEEIKQNLTKAIKSHDKIIFLGHGLPHGLINPEAARHNNLSDLLLLSHQHASLLKDKETVSVWCFSDQYFAHHNLSGFHTGMIISETKEAEIMLGHCPLSEQALHENMIRFAKIIGECIEQNAHEMKEYLLKHYVGNDEITQFNRQNITVLP